MNQNKEMYLVKKLHKILMSLYLLTAINAHASLVGISAGYYAVDATNSNGTTSLSNIGSYRVFMMHDFENHFALNVGYNMIFEQYITGDSAFGFDIGFNYFHFGMGNTIHSKIGNVVIKSIQEWSPYLGISFNQRQYQSVRTAYSGIGFSLGTLKNLSKSISLSMDFRYVPLSGAVESTASEMTVMGGIAYEY
jgi:hypothetical protein